MLYIYIYLYTEKRVNFSNKKLLHLIIDSNASYFFSLSLSLPLSLKVAAASFYFSNKTKEKKFLERKYTKCTENVPLVFLLVNLRKMAQPFSQRRVMRADVSNTEYIRFIFAINVSV